MGKFTAYNNNVGDDWVQVTISGEGANLLTEDEIETLLNPAPKAHVQGRPDGHCGDDAAWKEFVERYGKMSREELGKGNMSDFALANAQFMCDRNSLGLIVYQTAVKDRIRWLSIQLAKSLAAAPEASDNG